MDDYDVIVIGGGAAGLSGAMCLGRARRSVLVLDAGAPRNAPASGVHNFLTRDGIPPAELVALGADEVARYGGEVRRARAVTARRDETGLTVTTADGRTATARRLLVATGLVDELPDVPGVRERWGRDVLHCPYCHGWEVRDQPIGVLATGPRAVHQALLFRQLSPDVVLFRHTASPLADEEAEELAARDVAVVDGEVVGLEVADDRLAGVRLASGTVVARQALAVAPGAVVANAVLDALGLVAVEHPMGVGTHLATDSTGQTAVPGVWAAGNVVEPMAQVMAAAAGGLSAGANDQCRPGRRGGALGRRPPPRARTGGSVGSWERSEVGVGV
jgi:thioredoxin reductase